MRHIGKEQDEREKKKEDITFRFLERELEKENEFSVSFSDVHTNIEFIANDLKEIVNMKNIVKKLKLIDFEEKEDSEAIKELAKISRAIENHKTKGIYGAKDDNFKIKKN